MRRLVARLAEHPEQFAFVEAPIRLAIVAGFPYYLPFREGNGKIEILGVCHASRRHGYWDGRVQDRDAGDELPS